MSEPWAGGPDGWPPVETVIVMPADPADSEPERFKVGDTVTLPDVNGEPRRATVRRIVNGAIEFEVE